VFTAKAAEWPTDTVQVGGEDAAEN